MNHAFIVLNKHFFCILWSQNSPLFSLSHSRVSSFEESSVNHIFIVLNKHFLYLVVAKFPSLFSSPFARFLLWAQGTENIKVLNHRFSYYRGKEYRSSYQEPRYIEVHEVVVLLLIGFLTTFSEGLFNGNIKRLPTKII